MLYIPFVSPQTKMSDIAQLFSCLRWNGCTNSNAKHTGGMIHGTTKGCVARGIQQALQPAALVTVWLVFTTATRMRHQQQVTEHTTQHEMKHASRIPDVTRITYSSCTHRHVTDCTGKTARTTTEIRKTKIYKFCMSVKIGLSTARTKIEGHQDKSAGQNTWT